MIPSILYTLDDGSKLMVRFIYKWNVKINTAGKRIPNTWNPGKFLGTVVSRLDRSEERCFVVKSGIEAVKLWLEDKTVA